MLRRGRKPAKFETATANEIHALTFAFFKARRKRKKAQAVSAPSDLVCPPDADQFVNPFCSVRQADQSNSSQASNKLVQIGLFDDGI